MLLEYLHRIIGFYCEKVSKSNGTPNLYSGYFFNTTFVVVVDDNDTKNTVNQKLQNAMVFYQLSGGGFTDIEITASNLINQLDTIDGMLGYDGTTIITSTYDESNAQMFLEVSALKGV